MNGFFPSATTLPRDVTDFDTNAAKKLFVALQKNGKIRSAKSSAKNWAMGFRNLRNDGIAEKRIESVLQFYLRNIGQPFIPQAFSSSAFRKKFLAIETASEKPKSQILQKVLITPKAHQVSNEAGELIWPNKEKASELMFIQISLNNYADFLDQISSIAESEKKTQTYEYARHLSRSIQWEPEVVVTAHVARVHALATKWDGWDGDLLRWVWAATSKWTREEMQSLLFEYDCDKYSWKKILDLIRTIR